MSHARQRCLALTTILVGFGLAVALLGLVEILFRIHPLFTLQGKIAYRGDAVPPMTTGKQTRIPIRLLPSTYPARPWPRLYPLEISRDPDYTTSDPQIGSRPRPNGRYHSWAKMPDGKIAYDVHYTIDAFGRRVVPGTERSKQPPLLILGCSFAYGEGLEDDETLGYQLSKQVPGFRPYLYAFSGWGPGNLLRWLKTPDFGDDLPKSGGKAIYIFIEDHIRRVLGSLSLYRSFPAWTSSLPYYWLDESGQLETHGFLDSTGRPWTDPLLRVLAKSALLNSLSIEIPAEITAAHLQLFTKVVEEMQATLREKLGISELIVVIHPETEPSLVLKNLLTDLDRAGIRSLDYTSIDLTRYLKGVPGLPDGHPSAELNQFLAGQIVRDLGL